MHYIRSVEAEADRLIKLTFDTGEIGIIDLADTIEQGGVFEPLRDPAFFRQVAVGERGRFIEWPGGIDFCADALWQDAHAAGLLKS